MAVSRASAVGKGWSNLAKTAIAVGAESIRKTAEILALAETSKATIAGLMPGTQWGGDRLLLSIEDGCAQFVVGNTLYNGCSPFRFGVPQL